MPPDTIRRHPDGSVDIDFYRVKAGRLRARAIRGFFRKPFAKSALIVAAALAVIAMFLGPTPVGKESVGIGKSLEARVEIG
jgi:hypothetical protein